jgi:hypothetical protein
LTATLSQLLTNSRSILDEASASFWSDAELTVLINDCQREIARRTETLQQTNNAIDGLVGQGIYALPRDAIRLHRIEFQPTNQSTQIYPMEFTTREQLDRIWGFYQQRQSSYPQYAVLWGMPPTITMQVYPVPAQPGTFNIFYYRLPVPLVNSTDTSDIPDGWEDLVPLFVSSMAKRKDHDPTWQEDKATFEERLTYMIDVTRHYHDQSSGNFMADYMGGVPQWLSSFEW